MSNRSAPLKELLELHDTGVWGPEDPSEGISVLRSTNFGKDGELQFEKLTFRSVDSKKRRSKLLQPNDIILEKSGGGPKQPVGRVCRFRGHHMTHAFGNFTARLRANQSLVDPEYLFWSLRNLHLSGGTLQYQKRTSGIRNLEMKRYLAHPLPLPPLDEQRRIVAILNRAAKIERLKKQAQKRLREFIPALFTKMFGDPATNPMGWEMSHIGQVCMQTKTRNPSKAPSTEFRYIDISGIDTVQKRIAVTRSLLGKDAPSRARKEIRRDDIIVSSVRPNLNAAAIVPDDLDREVASTGFSVLRSNRDRLEPLYLFCHVTSEYFVETISSKVRGANYPAVSDADIKNVLIAVPPLKEQRQFALTAQSALHALKNAQSGACNAERLTESLMSRLLESGMVCQDSATCSSGSPEKVELDYAGPIRKVR